jgi:hypothetical protein
MDKKLFADLVESMQQHNEITAGARKPPPGYPRWTHSQ